MFFQIFIFEICKNNLVFAALSYNPIANSTGNVYPNYIPSNLDSKNFSDRNFTDINNKKIFIDIRNNAIITGKYLYSRKEKKEDKLIENKFCKFPIENYMDDLNTKFKPKNFEIIYSNSLENMHNKENIKKNKKKPISNKSSNKSCSNSLKKERFFPMISFISYGFTILNKNIHKLLKRLKKMNQINDVFPKVSDHFDPKFLKKLKSNKIIEKKWKKKNLKKLNAIKKAVLNRKKIKSNENAPANMINLSKQSYTETNVYKPKNKILNNRKYNYQTEYKIFRLPPYVSLSNKSKKNQDILNYAFIKNFWYKSPIFRINFKNGQRLRLSAFSRYKIKNETLCGPDWIVQKYST